MNEERGKMNIGKFSVIIWLVLLIIILPMLGACTKEVIKEVPVEKVVEKEVIKEVPVEKVVEKEVVKEVPVEESAQFKEGVIKIGLPIDLSGPLAIQGRPTLEVMQDYVKYINTEKGGLQGHKLELMWGDTKLEVPQIISVYERFKNNGAVGVFTCSTPGDMALRAKVDADRIPAVSVSGNLFALKPPGYIHCWVPTHADQCCGYVDWFLETWKEERPPKFAFLTLDNPAGKNVLVPEVASYIEVRGVEIVGTELVPMVPVDITPQLSRIEEAGADFTYGVLYSINASAIARTAKKLDVTYVIAGHNAVIAEDLGKLVGSDADGFRITYCTATIYDDVLGNQMISEWREKYREVTDLVSMHEVGLVMISIMVEAIDLALQEVGYENLDGAAVKEYGFNSIKGFDPFGLCPPITYVPGSVIGNDKFRVVEMKDGKPFYLTEPMSGTDVFSLKK